MLSVKKIENKTAYPFLLKIHYAKRIPSISFAYGLYDGDELIGCATYGKPSSSNLRNGVCGKEKSPYVFELNRLVLKHNRKNEASFLVGNSLRMLPKPMIIVSYSDTEQNHFGIVYQACNFIYTGLSAKRSDYKVKGMEHIHSTTITDMARGQPDRTKFLKEKFGDKLYLKDRSRKHRYVFFTGKKKEVKDFKKSLLYGIEPYPKGKSSRSIVSTEVLAEVTNETKVSGFDKYCD